MSAKVSKTKKISENIKRTSTKKTKKKAVSGKNEGEKKTIEKSTPEESTIEKTLIDTNISISESVDSMAEKLDIYLTGSKVTSRKNETRIFVELSGTIRDSQPVTSAFNFGGDLRLPNLEERWRLKFSNKDRTKERGQSPRYTRTQSGDPTRDQSLGAGLSVAQKIGTVRANYQPHLLLRDRPGLSHSIDFETDIQFVNSLKMNIEVEFFANADIGPGVAHSINFIYPVNSFIYWSQNNEAKYVDQTHEYLVTHSLAYNLSLSEKDSLSYSTFLSSKNREVFHMFEYGLATAYSRNIYKKILDFSAIPHIIFNKDENFKGIPGLNLGFILNF